MRSIVFILFSTIVPFLHAQDLVSTEFKGKIYRDTAASHNETDTICFLQEGKSLKTTTTESGKFTLKVEFDPSRPFEVKFTSPGYVSKAVVFDMTKASTEFLSKEEGVVLIESLNMTMTDNPLDHDLEIIVGKLFWSPKVEGVMLDFVHASKQKEFVAYLEKGDGYELKPKFDLGSDQFFPGQVYSPKQKIRFKLAKWDIDSSSFPQLDSIASFLKTNSNFIVEIGYHRDSRGSKQMSMKLGQVRAESVKEYLVLKGVSEDQLIPKSYGESKPIVTDEEIAKMTFKKDIEEAHFKNRRTVFTIISVNRTF